MLKILIFVFSCQQHLVGLAYVYLLEFLLNNKKKSGSFHRFLDYYYSYICNVSNGSSVSQKKNTHTHILD